MNILINIYALDKIDEKTIGILMPEVIRNPEKKISEPSIKGAIKLNHLIKEFTFNHPSFNKTSEKINIKLSKCAREITEIFYDHMLASNWEHYSPIPFQDLSSEVYNYIKKNSRNYPTIIKKHLSVVTYKELLLNYKTIQGTSLNIDKLSKFTSTRLDAKSQLALFDLAENYPLIKEEFMIYMSDLTEYLSKVELSIVEDEIVFELLTV